MASAQVLRISLGRMTSLRVGCRKTLKKGSGVHNAERLEGSRFFSSARLSSAAKQVTEPRARRRRLSAPPLFVTASSCNVHSSRSISPWSPLWGRKSFSSSLGLLTSALVAETRGHLRELGACRASLAPAAELSSSRPELDVAVVVEDDLESPHYDEELQEAVANDARALLHAAQHLILERIVEEEEEEDERQLAEHPGEERPADVMELPPERVELSVLLCSDAYIQSLNATWRNVDKPTDVLSFPQLQPEGLTSTVLLGDVIISLDMAAQQAQERGHSVRDELRILMVHGLLHLLGLDHEEGPEAAQEMAARERELLASLAWRGDGLIALSEGAAADSAVPGGVGSASSAAAGAAAGGQRKGPSAPPFKLLLCDMDGTLLDSRSRVKPCTAEALRAAVARGVRVGIATGKARPAAMAALATAGLAGEGGIVTLDSPGVFIQGLRVYGEGGTVVHNALLPTHVVVEAFEFSLQHKLALIGFSGDHCVTMRDHPLVEQLHTKYYEPRALVFSSVDEILNEHPIQKLLFYDSEEGITSFVRPHWAQRLSPADAALTQAVPDMLEVLPPGQSKGSGVQILLDSLGIHKDEVMALGDGENDKEMIEMVGWGVAMANGSPITKAVAKAVVGSNDDGGIAEAIGKFILI